jgi:hypothetical protein
MAAGTGEAHKTLPNAGSLSRNPIADPTRLILRMLNLPQAGYLP